MRKTFPIGLILVVVIVAAISWYMFSTRPSPGIVAPITEDRQPVHSPTTQQDVGSQPLSDASDTTVTKESVVLPTREQTNSIPEGSRLPMTNVIELGTIQNPKTEIAEVKVDNQHVNEVSQDKALEIARGAIGKTKYATALPIAIKDAAGEYRITFPVDKTVPEGTRYRGPDYAAEVHIDKKTGKVIQVRLGE